MWVDFFHMALPMLVRHGTVLQIPHESLMSCPYRTHINTHLGPMCVLYFLLAGLGAFRAFVRFALVWFCLFPLPLSVWEGLWFVIVALPGLFCYPFVSSGEDSDQTGCPLSLTSLCSLHKESWSLCYSLGTQGRYWPVIAVFTGPICPAAAYDSEHFVLMRV